MNTLLSVSVALLAGLIMTRFFKPLKLPAVTAYLIAGVLIGPYCIGALGIEGFGFSTAEHVSKLELVSNVALGFIAFSIGNEFRVSELKKTGKQALVIVNPTKNALTYDLNTYSGNWNLVATGEQAGSETIAVEGNEKVSVAGYSVRVYVR
jgi:predicted Kef-type K+ transport protein